MKLREIQQKDNKQVEDLVRTCLIEFGGDRPGTVWSDSTLPHMYELYQNEKSKYYVAEENGIIVAGCGIGPVKGVQGVCELQKMYSLKEVRGAGIAKKLLDLSLEFAKQYYKQCYLETFSNMLAAKKFYLKNNFKPLDKPIIDSEHYYCDAWYIKEL